MLYRILYAFYNFEQNKNSVRFERPFYRVTGRGIEKAATRGTVQSNLG